MVQAVTGMAAADRIPLLERELLRIRNELEAARAELRHPKSDEWKAGATDALWALHQLLHPDDRVVVDPGEIMQRMKAWYNAAR